MHRTENRPLKDSVYNMSVQDLTQIIICHN